MKALISYLSVFFTIVTLLFFASCSHKTEMVANYKTVPLPQKTEMLEGSNFILDGSTQISYPADKEELQYLAKFLSEYIEQATGYKLSITSEENSKNTITLNTNYSNENKEAYQLTVNSDNISINGASASGLFYGMQTLRKSIPISTKQEIAFPRVQIIDYPEYKHRGGMLDVVRHFSSTDFVKKYIDVLAMCNMNVFHWHLTDDQGWRIEIKKHPKLTEIGAYRDSTVIGRHTNTYTPVRHGGFYTQEEIKDIVEYARLRHITVIPEIDLPGHMMAALTSYPELGCTGGPYHVGAEWGVYEDVLCVGNEQIFTFLNDIFDEVATLFPANYIHIGGDECPKNRWMACSKCKAKMKALNIKENKEHTAGEQLQSYVMVRVEKMLNQKGKRIIGWDEILEGGIAPDATIMSWRGINGGVYAANKGHDVIMTPEEFLYLDYYQSSRTELEPYTFGWLTELKKVYSFDPMPSDLDENKKQHILGAQVNLWVEYIPTSKNVEYMLLPRMCALAETVWTNPKKKDYNEFVSRLHNLSKHFDHLGYENCKQAYDIQDSLVVDTNNNVLKLYLSTFDNRAISYSINDSIDSNDQVPTEPIIIKKPTTIIAHDGSNYQRNFEFNKATAKPITLKYQPDIRYTFSGANMLVDGQIGLLDSYRTGSWIGFSGTDFEAVIDLKEKTEVNRVTFNCFVNTRGGLFPPTSFDILVSDDNINFTSFYHNDKYSMITDHSSPSITSEESASDKPANARYVKIIIGSIKNLPDWHEKKGDEALLMLDEIRIL